MRKLWTTDPETIQQELELVITDKVPFNLFQHGQPARNLIAHEITEKDQIKHIIFTKLAPFSVAEKMCYLVYQRPGDMMRGFNGPSKRESDLLLAVPLPTEIFQIQRRKLPRFVTPGNSKASIALDYAKMPNTAAVKDISQEGARLSGTLSPRIRKNDVIGPISFTLCLQLASLAIDTFTVPKATVAWVRENEEGNHREIGITFKLSGSAQMTLEHYIKLRTIENAANQNNEG